MIPAHSDDGHFQAIANSAKRLGGCGIAETIIHEVAEEQHCSWIETRVFSPRAHTLNQFETWNGRGRAAVMNISYDEQTKGIRHTGVMFAGKDSRLNRKCADPRTVAFCLRRETRSCRFARPPVLEIRTVTSPKLRSALSNEGRELSVHLVAILLVILASTALCTGLEQSFQDPPQSAKPWTYWFWLNGNITEQGITADLEAMARVGMGGVLIMEVARPKNMAPQGDVEFATPRWNALFKHALTEARRLGMQVNMNNDAGWCGSGGPWITPELSMQKLVATSATLTGPARFERVLARPKAVRDYYHDIRVLAMPVPEKSESATSVSGSIIDLTGKMQLDGKLVWDAPAGKWQIWRIGATTTGRTNKPAPVSGTGLECDKFNPAATKFHFDHFIAKLADDAGPDLRKALVSTHIDSWEVGTQTWTPNMFDEFRRRRGYDLGPWLITAAGGPSIESEERTARFRWDFKRTQAELNDEYYAKEMCDLAHGLGMELSIEPYGTGEFLNTLTYGACADLPFAEFWISRWGAWHLQSPRLVSSAAHVYNKPVVAAESFTSSAENDAFTEHPYSIKTTGDWAFSQGINRFVFHRSVLQPWSADFVPGMSFAGWGWHVDRHQTWFEPGAAFMRYVARCQALLQQGKCVADVCRLVPDGEHSCERALMRELPSQYEAIPAGYSFDYISDKAVLEEMKVEDGRLITPGSSYRLLQLPASATDMTPGLLRKVRDLIKGGAVVIGPRPVRSSSLQDYPQCDREIQALGQEAWGDCNGTSVTEHALGAGHVFWGKPVAEVLQRLTAPDLEFVIDPPLSEEATRSITNAGRTLMGEPAGAMPTAGINWIHRRTAENDDLYFVANPQHRDVDALCTFRVKDRQPEIWNPESGEMRVEPVCRNTTGGVQLPIHFDPAGAVFVVFRRPTKSASQIVQVMRDGSVLFGAEQEKPAQLPQFSAKSGRTTFRGSEPGQYEVVYADGRREALAISRQTSVTLSNPWTVQFQAKRGAPEKIEMAELIDWAKHPQPDVRYFSGTATYSTRFDWKPDAAKQAPGIKKGSRPTDGGRWLLDLGDVKVMAQVALNGKDLGVLWKPPFTVDVTDALCGGENRLDVKVTNLWPNRLIGDEQYRDDCTTNGTWLKGPIPAWPEWFVKHQARPEPRRVTFTTWKYFPKDSPLLPSGILGPVRLREEGVQTAMQP